MDTGTEVMHAERASLAGRTLTQESCMVAIVDPEASVEVGFTRNRPETPGLRPEEACMAAVQ